jgi:hypothetical protein
LAIAEAIGIISEIPKRPTAASVNGPTDFKFVLEHENFLPKKPKAPEVDHVRRLRKRIDHPKGNVLQ